MRGSKSRAWSVIALAIGAASLAACAGRAEPPANAEKRFVGSEKCASCHQDIYNRWKNTLMAKVIQDPAKHPEAIRLKETMSGTEVTGTSHSNVNEFVTREILAERSSGATTRPALRGALA